MTMPIEQTPLIRNLIARARHTAGLTPQPVMTGAEAVEALHGWVYKKPGMATKDDCIAACERVQDRFGQSELMALLQRFGVTALKDLWIGMYQDFVRFADATIKHDTPPSSSWSGDTPIKQEEEL